MSGIRGALDAILSWRGNNTVGPRHGIAWAVADVAALPTCSESIRRAQYVVEGGSGVADTLYTCLKDASNAYGWEASGFVSGSGLVLGPWYADNLAGTASDRVFALLVMATTTSVAQPSANPGNELLMPRSGRIVGAFMNSSAARTAGTATLRVSVSGSISNFASGSCVLNGTNTTITSAWDDSGPTFAAAQYIRPVVTTASWTPTTADVTAWLAVRFDP